MAHPVLWWQGNDRGTNGALSNILPSSVEHHKVVKNTANRCRKCLPLIRQRLVSFGAVMSIYLSISYLRRVL